jgi:hypothetical protein
MVDFVLKGRGFSRAVTVAKFTAASAAELRPYLCQKISDT